MFTSSNASASASPLHGAAQAVSALDQVNTIRASLTGSVKSASNGTKTMQLCNTVAAIVAALNTADTANEAAATAKFSAVLDIAALVAYSTRLQMATGENFETNAKGERVYLIDTSKDVRSAFVAALIAGRGLDAANPDHKGKLADANNIAALGRTFSRYVVAYLMDNGVLATVKTGEDVRAAIETAALTFTGGVASYQALEQARSRKWAAPVETADTDAKEGEEVATSPLDVNMAGDLPELQLDASGLPDADAETAETHGPRDFAVTDAVLRLTRALNDPAERDALSEQGFGQWLANASKAWREHVKAEEAAKQALKAQA